MTPPAALHIFRAGTYTSMAGHAVTLSAADLAATAAAYDPTRHEAPLVVGHPEHNAPAHGWVAALAADGADLRAVPRDVSTALAEAVRARRFSKVSASFWPPTHPANPAPGVWSLRHVGLLGAAVPAVLGLDPVALAGAPEGLVTIETDPFQTTAAFAGPPAHLLESSMAHDPSTPVGAPESTPPLAEFAAREARIAAREAELQALELELQARESATRVQAEALRRDAVVSFVDGLVAQGRLLPVEQAPLVALLMTAPDTPSVDFAAPVEHGEPSARDAASWLRDWLPTLPVRVPYGEFAAPDGHDPETARIEAAARVMAGLPPLTSERT